VDARACAALVEEGLLRWQDGRLAATDAGLLRLDAILPLVVN
jgi:hypothetical protein